MFLKHEAACQLLPKSVGGSQCLYRRWSKVCERESSVVVVNVTDPGVRLNGFKPFVALGNVLYLHLFICQMEIITVSTWVDYYENGYVMS